LAVDLLEGVLQRIVIGDIHGDRNVRLYWLISPG
jgi:hypothetical protein